MTIHNMAYQGSFWHWDMPLTGLDWRFFNWQALDFHGRLNFLKAGLVFADMLATVSPTYAREIQGPALGCGLDGLLAGAFERPARDRQRHRRRGRNPRVDPLILARYDAETVAGGKAACKGQLQRRAGLPERLDVPLFAQDRPARPSKRLGLARRGR